MLLVEVWDDDDIYINNTNDKIDSFTFPFLGMPYDFEHSNAMIVQGKNGIGNLTVNHYNITNDPASCNSVDTPTITTFPNCQKGKLVTERDQLVDIHYVT